MFCQMYPHAISSPSIPLGKDIWWPRVVLSYVQLTWAHVLLSVIYHLLFSRVLCKRLSSFFICNPQYPPDSSYTPCWPPDTQPHYRHLVVKSGTPVGQHDVLSACQSGWYFVICTPPANHPHMPPQWSPWRSIWWPIVVLTSVQLTWVHFLLSATDHVEFSRVLCNRLSSFLYVNPQCPLHPLLAP